MCQPFALTAREGFETNHCGPNRTDCNFRPGCSISTSHGVTLPLAWSACKQQHRSLATAHRTSPAATSPRNGDTAIARTWLEQWKVLRALAVSMSQTMTCTNLACVEASTDDRLSRTWKQDVRINSASGPSYSVSTVPYQHAMFCERDYDR